MKGRGDGQEDYPMVFLSWISGKRRSKNIRTLCCLYYPPHFRCSNHPFRPPPLPVKGLCCTSSPTISSFASPSSSPSQTKPQIPTTSLPSFRHVDTSTTPSQNHPVTTFMPTSSKQSSIPLLPSVVSVPLPCILQTSPSNSSGIAAS